MLEPWRHDQDLRTRAAHWSETTLLTLAIAKELVLGVVHLFLDQVAKKPPFRGGV